jgi:hypothetical protein
MPQRRRRQPQQPDRAAAIEEQRQLAQQELDLIDALRAWHRFQHGDESGAMMDVENGVEVPEEMAALLAAAAVAHEDYEVLTAVAEDYGHDSDMFDDAATTYLSSLGKLCEASAAMQPEEEEEAPPASAGVRRGPGQGRGAQGRPQGKGGVAPKAAGMPRAAAVRAAAAANGVPAGGLRGGVPTGADGMPNPQEVLPPAGSPMDLGKISGLPPSIGAGSWGGVGKAG